MPLACAEPRLAPLPSASLVVGGPPRSSMKRSQSYSGYAPHHLCVPSDALGRGDASPRGAARAALAAPDGGAAEPWSGPGEHEESCCGGDAPEPWPDTDSELGEPLWSPRGRGRAWESCCEGLEAGRAGCAWGLGCAPAPAPAGAWGGSEEGGPRDARGGAAALLGGPAPPSTPLCALPVPTVPAPIRAPVLRWPALLVTTMRGALCSQVDRAAVPSEAAAVKGMEDALARFAALEAGEEAPRVAGKRKDARAGSEASNTDKSKKGKKGKTEPPEGATTLMLGGIPSEVTQHELLREIDLSGFAGRFDFCYIPHNFSTRKNRGQAYVNFTSPTAAREFRVAWRGRLTCAGRNVVHPGGINISKAALQGLAANMARLECPRMKRVRNTGFLPYLAAGSL